MKTFKQFLESHDPLESLQIQLFFREEVNLSKEEAEEAALWIVGGNAPFRSESDTWPLIMDYIEETTGAVIYHMARGSVEDFVRQKLTLIMRQKYGIEL
jgi:hypothetical protein